MTKKFIWGFIFGFGTSILIVIILLVYSTSQILQKLEQESSNEHLFDKPLIRVEQFPILYSIKDTTLILSLKEKNGKVLIFNYWATWCKPCVEEMDSFINLYNLLGDNSNVEFAFISFEPIDKQLKFINSKGWNLPFFFSKANKDDDLYPRKWPTTLIIKNDLVFLKLERKFNWESQEIIDFIKGLNN